MKNSIILLIFCLLITACRKKDSTAITPVQKEQNASGNSPDHNSRQVADSTLQSKAGVHPVSLQWIGWDKPGKAQLSPLAEGWYSIEGSQRNDNSDYFTINGKIRRVSDQELEFLGTIETLVSTINGGAPCIKEGKQIFYAKGNRTYFRLQNMENCEGGNLVDYIDIFPGTSSL